MQKIVATLRPIGKGIAAAIANLDPGSGEELEAGTCDADIRFSLHCSQFHISPPGTSAILEARPPPVPAT
jgi:hypothetical protein